MEEKNKENNANAEVTMTKLQPNSPTQPKESKTWKFVTAAVLIALLAFIWIFMVEDTADIIDRDTTLCIAENSVFYGTEWCGYCKIQKEMFGTNVDKLNYIDCDEDRDACMVAEIAVFPSWDINGERYTGVQSKEELKEFTGC